MGGVFSKPKAPDTSAQDAALAEQEAEEAAKEEKNKARIERAKRGKRSLMYDTEEGVKKSTTLGA